MPLYDLPFPGGNATFWKAEPNTCIHDSTCVWCLQAGHTPVVTQVDKLALWSLEHGSQ